MDLIRELGPMALGSRLKRLTVRMNKDVSRVYHELGFEFEARWFPVAYLLGRLGPLSITEIASALNYTHTAIKKFANEMARKRLLETVRDKTDRRRRILRLTRKGRRVMDQLAPVWREIHAAARELVDASEPNLLEAIGSLERQLDRKEVYARIRERMRPRLLDAIEIVEYRSAYKRHFRDLNYEWLRKHLNVEPHDEQVLADPVGQIIVNGGAVLFARLQRRIVGTAALLRHPNGVYELTKMAVTESARRRLVGTKLTLEIIERARSEGGRYLYLETHPKLKAAQRLYGAVGFERVDDSPIPPAYHRRRILMRIAL